MNSTCAPSRCARALADPQEVRGAVVRHARARVDARQRALVVEQQRLVAREEVDGA